MWGKPGLSSLTPKAFAGISLHKLPSVPGTLIAPAREAVLEAFLEDHCCLWDALQKLWFVGSHGHPLAEARASRRSVSSQELREGNSICLSRVCSSYTLSAGLSSPQVPLKQMTTSRRVRLFIIWKKLNWSAGKTRVSFRNVLALGMKKAYFFPREILLTGENSWFYVAWNEVLLRWLMCPHFKELFVVVDIAGFIYPSSQKKKKSPLFFHLFSSSLSVSCPWRLIYLLLAMSRVAQWLCLIAVLEQNWVSGNVCETDTHFHPWIFLVFCHPHNNWPTITATGFMLKNKFF